MSHSAKIMREVVEGLRTRNPSDPERAYLLKVALMTANITYADFAKETGKAKSTVARWVSSAGVPDFAAEAAIRLLATAAPSLTVTSSHSLPIAPPIQGALSIDRLTIVAPTSSEQETKFQCISEEWLKNGGESARLKGFIWAVNSTAHNSCLAGRDGQVRLELHGQTIHSPWSKLKPIFEELPMPLWKVTRVDVAVDYQNVRTTDVYSCVRRARNSRYFQNAKGKGFEIGSRNSHVKIIGYDKALPNRMRLEAQIKPNKGPLNSRYLSRLPLIEDPFARFKSLSHLRGRQVNNDPIIEALLHQCHDIGLQAVLKNLRAKPKEEKEFRAFLEYAETQPLQHPSEVFTTSFPLAAQELLDAAFQNPNGRKWPSFDQERSQNDFTSTPNESP